MEVARIYLQHIMLRWSPIRFDRPACRRRAGSASAVDGTKWPVLATDVTPRLAVGPAGSARAREASALPPKDRCAAALTGQDTDLIGLDIVAEELRPLGWVLWDALHGSSTTDLG